MAISVLTVWEVRPGVGSDSNGGGFVSGASGTDYSQQNSAQYSFTDLASISSLVVSSASHNFVASDVGNLINIASGTGFTVGFYQIVSVASNQATLDRSPGTVGVGGSYAVGGALATLDTIMTRAGAYSQTNGVNGNTIYMKATNALVFTAGHQDYDLEKFALIGYTSTRTDNGQATISTATNSVYIFAPGNAGFTAIFKNIIMSSSAGTPGNAIDFASNNVGYLVLINCKVTGFASGIATGSAICYHLALFNTEITACTGDGLALQQVYSMQVSGSYIHANTGDGVRFSGTSLTGSVCFTQSVIKSNAYGVRNTIDGQYNQSTDLRFIGCAILDNTNDGIRQQGTGTQYGQELMIENCIIDSNGGYGVALATSLSLGTIVIPLGRNNAFRGNSGGDRQNFPTLDGDIVLTGDPFTNRGSGDFTLNNTAGAGAACRGAGFQSSILG